MSEQGYNPGVEAGQSVRQSAPVMNKMSSYIDEVANGVPRGIRLTPQSKSTHETGRLVSLAEATEDIDNGEWLNIVGVNIDSTENENYFNYGDCLPKVEKLLAATENVTLAVAMEPIESGGYGRICIAGCCVAKISAPSASAFSYCDSNDVASPGVLTATDSKTGVPIFWNAGTAGENLAFVGVNFGAHRGVFAVDLTQVGGAQGTQTTSPTWTYDVFDAMDRGTGPTALETGVDPTASPHNWVRHLGQMAAATFGLAYYNADGDLELTWINEILIAAECV